MDRAGAYYLILPSFIPHLITISLDMGFTTPRPRRRSARRSRLTAGDQVPVRQLRGAAQGFGAQTDSCCHLGEPILDHVENQYITLYNHGISSYQCNCYI